MTKGTRNVLLNSIANECKVFIDSSEHIISQFEMQRLKSILI